MGRADKVRKQVVHGPLSTHFVDGNSFTSFFLSFRQHYLRSMAAAANYAWVNRSAMTFLTRQAFAKEFSTTPDDLEMHVVYDVSHNIAKWEEVGSEETLSMCPTRTICSLLRVAWRNAFHLVLLARGGKGRASITVPWRLGKRRSHWRSGGRRSSPNECFKS